MRVRGKIKVTFIILIIEHWLLKKNRDCLLEKNILENVLFYGLKRSLKDICC